MFAYNYSCYYFTEWVQYGQLTYSQFAVVAFLNGITILPAIILNGLILVSIWRTPALHTPAMALVFNLAISDFFVGFLAQPVMMAWFAVELKATEMQSTYCYMSITMIVSSTFFSCSSFFVVTAIAVDRFLALYYHLRYPTIMTMRKAVAVSLVTWFASLFVIALRLTVGTKYRAVFSVFNSSLVATCELVVLFSYFKIYRILRKHQKQIHSANIGLELTLASPDSTEESISQTSLTQPQKSIRQYRKSIISSFYIYFAFILCYFPAICVLIYYSATDDHRVSAYFTKIAFCILVINSAINPGIYCWKMRELRNAVRQTLIRLRGITGLKTQRKFFPKRAVKAAWTMS
ncbi:predicted protein [Nematostella vectensis]|uniref:G-protein coupled receptors family 1 profile domain-containing protein n=1 Tax=Nematostella vectensis TaxID=45351 RepID=A7SHH2_NEMVE|nr:octopamine receptor beta-1R [Nematostella vectensis]EDO36843.1 predicted protein [Nematostella vectensis]|eukprot:XP_001628906.1 predicted protein [Nematostella vectensis]